MVMEKLKLPPLSQLAKVVVFLVLLVLIPFISTSLRPSYLYFLLNILILVVGVEAGFLRAISAPHQEKKPTTADIAASPANVEASSINMNTANSATDVDNLHLEKSMVERIKKCSSRPSLFFIGSLEGEERVKEEDEEEEEEEEWKEVGEMSKQELFAKAEMFIGNFYTQLKMQREESWKKLHELYHRAF